MPSPSYQEFLAFQEAFQNILSRNRKKLLQEFPLERRFFDPIGYTWAWFGSMMQSRDDLYTHLFARYTKI